MSHETHEEQLNRNQIRQHHTLNLRVVIARASIRACPLKEEFQLFWRDVSPYWAGRFLGAWCTRIMRSKIEPMKRVARMLRNDFAAEP